jgi:GNAT superfamily N-acetyltransferase
VGHIRHFATDVGAVRTGVGRALLARVLQTATAAGIRRLECLSTRTAVAFYQDAGFVIEGPAEVALDAGITFPAISMSRRLAS